MKYVPRPYGPRRTLAVTVAGATAAILAAGCSTASSSMASGSAHQVRVVAAEDFWGSIAKQLGGSHVVEKSLITNPNVDPHSYEPTAADGRAVSEAQFVIGNGVGYDGWFQKFLRANTSSSRKTLIVGDMLGLKDGDNPHRWYSPGNVHQVIERITATYKRLDPADAAYFDQQKTTFETRALAPYDQLISDIRAKYAGTPVGASESIVSPLADALGLRMLTPYSFLKAISEGTDISASDKSTIDRQLTTKQVKVYIYNSQNSTPDISAQVRQAQAEGIPVTTVTETLSPAGTPFQVWQTAQLRGIEAALAKATGR
jgi:zinc/manganese transport system substrate-binding protein